MLRCLLVTVVAMGLDGCCRVCVLTLASSHPVVSEAKKISSVDFLVDVKVSTPILCFYISLFINNF